MAQGGGLQNHYSWVRLPPAPPNLHTIPQQPSTVSGAISVFDTIRFMDVWTKQAPDGTTIIFKKEGSKETGFVYTAEGRMLKETSAMPEDLTKAETEAYFDDYVKGAKAAIQVQGTCPQSDCGKEWKALVAPKKGELKDYSITCPAYEKAFMKKLPGPIVAGPKLRESGD